MSAKQFKKLNQYARILNKSYHEIKSFYKKLPNQVEKQTFMAYLNHLSYEKLDRKQRSINT